MALSRQQLSQNREDFLDILRNTTEIPEKSPQILKFLDDSDFWDAPASTRYHDCCEGGLVQHSLKVYEHLSMLNYNNLLGFSDEAVAKTSLFHDLCKANFYERGHTNKKLEDGRWVRVETFKVEDQLPIGHGEKSVILLVQHGVELTEEEALAIRWHMGAYDSAAKEYAGSQALSNSMTKHKLVTALHLADMMAVWL